MGDVALGTLYDFNKSILASAEALKDISDKEQELKKFFKENEYFMLLCNELKDYTVFRLTTENKIDVAIKDLKECLNNRGEILSFEKTSDDFAFEVWMRIENEVYLYFLFPYDNAVIVC